jgi:hypothetical protein
MQTETMPTKGCCSVFWTRIISHAAIRDSLASSIRSETIIGHLMEPRVPDTTPLSAFGLQERVRATQILKHER